MFRRLVLSSTQADPCSGTSAGGQVTSGRGRYERLLIALCHLNRRGCRRSRCRQPDRSAGRVPPAGSQGGS